MLDDDPAARQHSNVSKTRSSTESFGGRPVLRRPLVIRLEMSSTARRNVSG